MGVGDWERLFALDLNRGGLRHRDEFVLRTWSDQFVERGGDAIAAAAATRRQAHWVLDENDVALEHGETVALQHFEKHTRASVCVSGFGSVRGGANIASKCSPF